VLNNCVAVENVELEDVPTARFSGQWKRLFYGWNEKIQEERIG